MIQIYNPDNTNYEKNGDMTLLPTEAAVHAVLNAEWEGTIEHPIDPDGRWKYIQEDAVVKMPSFNGEQLFRITKKTKKDSKISATMMPIFFDAKNDCFLQDVRPTDKNGQEALDIMLRGTKKYKAKSDITTISTAYYQTKNLIEALNGEEDNAFTNRWGGEIIYDNYTAIINKRAGEDNGVEILYGKNIPEDGMSEDIDMSDVCTRIFPKAYNGYVMTGETPWVDSPLIDTYPIVHWRVISFEDVKMKEDASEDDEENGIIVCNNNDELNEALKLKCKKQFQEGIDKPKVTIETEMIILENTDLYEDVKGLEKVGLGDTVHCKHSVLGIRSDERVIELEYDSIEKKTSSVVIGEFQYSFVSDAASTINRVDQSIREDGTLVGEQIQGIIDGVKAQMRVQSSEAEKQSVRAIFFEDLDPKSKLYGAMCLGTMGFQIANSRTKDNTEWDWKTFGTGQGFFADFIVAGTMLADRIKGGTLTLGGSNNVNGIAKVLDANGNEVVRLDKDGVYAWGKYVSDARSINRRVTIENGMITFSDKKEAGNIRLMYVNGDDGSNSRLLITYGGTSTDAGKDLLTITEECTYINTEQIHYKGTNGKGGTGKTGRLEFSNGTHLDVVSGAIVGGNTQEGSF